MKELIKKLKYLNTNKKPKLMLMLSQNQVFSDFKVLEFAILIPVKKSNNVEKINKNKNLQSQHE